MSIDDQVREYLRGWTAGVDCDVEPSGHTAGVVREDAMSAYGNAMYEAKIADLTSECRSLRVRLDDALAENARLREWLDALLAAVKPVLAYEGDAPVGCDCSECRMWAPLRAAVAACEEEVGR